MTAGEHSAELQNFVERGCLIKSNDGHLAYNLENDTYAKQKKLELSAKMKEAKVSKTKNKKRGLLVTPSKKPKRNENFRCQPKCNLFLHFCIQGNISICSDLVLIGSISNLLAQYLIL